MIPSSCESLGRNGITAPPVAFPPPKSSRVPVPRAGDRCLLLKGLVAASGSQNADSISYIAVASNRADHRLVWSMLMSESRFYATYRYDRYLIPGGPSHRPDRLLRSTGFWVRIAYSIVGLVHTVSLAVCA